MASCRLPEIGEQVESSTPTSWCRVTLTPWIRRRTAWYRLSPEPDEPSEACLGGRRWQWLDPTHDELLLFIDGRGACGQWAQCKAAGLVRLGPLFTRSAWNMNSGKFAA